MSQYPHLKEEQILQLLNALEPQEHITVIRIRYRNRDEIRSSQVMSAAALKTLVQDSIEEGHLPGSDLEVNIPALGQTLVRHHDGIFWLEPAA